MLIYDFWKYPEPDVFFFENIKEQYNTGKKRQCGMMHSWTLSANLGSDGIASFSKNGLT
jgi:hypothetical protein